MISTDTPLYTLTILEASKKLRAKECTVAELFTACSSHAQERNPELFAYLEIFPEDTQAIAAAQKRIDTEGDAAPLLCGIPICVKDNILIEGNIASAGSKILENYRAVYDATVITKLKDAGALFIGRTNMDEFGMGGSTEHSAYGPTKNPHDITRVPGGSSGGTAAGVAAHMAIAGLGTDTGGSIRQPSALCGLVGLKPTYGQVSRSGAIALASSLEQIGPITKTVADAKILFNTLRGEDSLDATTISETTYQKKDVPKTMRIGVPRSFLREGVTQEIKDLFEKQLEYLVSLGHTIVDIEIPTSKYALPVYYVIMPAEASTNLSRYDGVRYGLAKRGDTLLDDYLESRTEGFGEEPRRRILMGTFVLSAGYIDAYYRKAEAVRSVLRKEYIDAFTLCDVIAFPTTPSPAFAFGEKTDPVSMYIEDIFTVTANLTGMPALSVPMGTVASGESNLPVGIHFTAPHNAEEILFTIGAAVTREDVY